MNTIFAPLAGTAVSLQEVSDPVFSQEILGRGLAIQPLDGEVVAPADGEVTLVADTKHCVGITLKDGVEVLIHVGVDTTRLKGRHFTPLVKPGQRVAKGQPVLRFDLKKIRAKGYDTVVPVIVTTPDTPLSCSYGEVQKGQQLIQIG